MIDKIRKHIYKTLATGDFTEDYKNELFEACVCEYDEALANGNSKESAYEMALKDFNLEFLKDKKEDTKLNYYKSFGISFAVTFLFMFFGVILPEALFGLRSYYVSRLLIMSSCTGVALIIKSLIMIRFKLSSFKNEAYSFFESLSFYLPLGAMIGYTGHPEWFFENFILAYIAALPITITFLIIMNLVRRRSFNIPMIIVAVLSLIATVEQFIMMPNFSSLDVDSNLRVVNVFLSIIFLLGVLIYLVLTILKIKPKWYELISGIVIFVIIYLIIRLLNINFLVRDLFSFAIPSVLFIIQILGCKKLGVTKNYSHTVVLSYLAYEIFFYSHRIVKAINSWDYPISIIFYSAMNSCLHVLIIILTMIIQQCLVSKCKKNMLTE